ncbi:manganese efflux pump MntP [Desulforhabdus amnigena]|uniref:Putative manganese efflux pump MntP n=1 Tax=Desulforhabdus amnigena TaxID=40218 RepID=A0A9W6D2M2_9BACT|nr:manganese efflux pump MntP family protein [Desulforhabdus amnigena]GLI34138.1 putative manganese efflux pump MntP [Desulforhabdus amnigena]
MEFIETFLVAVALGCDAFAVGMGVGTRFCAPRQVFRLSFHFGLFQFLMPVIGWFLGQNMVGIMRRWAPWVAFALLFFIGAKMGYESLKPPESDKRDECIDPTRGFSLVMLSVATSIDALGVGIGLGIMGQSLFFSAICIGIVACAMTWMAMKLGNRLSEKFGRRMETVGGLILIGIAVKFLVA